MIKSSMKKLLKLISFFLISFFIVYAIWTYLEGWRVNRNSEEFIVWADSKLYRVANNSTDKDYFIPTRSQTELDAVLDNNPPETDICEVINWGESWKTYGECSVSCWGWSQPWTKTCTNPSPSCWGADCVGPMSWTDYTNCNSQPCCTSNASYACNGSNVYWKDSCWNWWWLKENCPNWCSWNVCNQLDWTWYAFWNPSSPVQITINGSSVTLANEWWSAATWTFYPPDTIVTDPWVWGPSVTWIYTSDFRRINWSNNTFWSKL